MNNAIIKKIQKEWRVEVIERSDDRFPKNLDEIKPEIKKLYYRGYWDENLFSKAAAVVGSRRMTRYGRDVTESLIIKLVSNGITVVSGFMYGIDTQAHQKTLEFGGKTIAVLGGGLDCIYPVENDKLYLEILEAGGLIISEYEADFKPGLWTFPQRNRIVAGLSNNGVYVIEAGIKSGSLITANLAHKQGKKVYAVPGMITSPTSEGTNILIAEGKAKMLTSLNNLEAKGSSKQESLFGQDNNKEIIEILRNEPMTIDELSKILQKSIADISVELTSLNLAGLIEEENGKYYLAR